MTKKHTIALANAIREHNATIRGISAPFDAGQINTLANFCAAQNPQFKASRWLDFIAGKCGPNGGAK
jgi:hypothetical protein